MIVRNWMNSKPHTITPDVLVTEAKRILSEENLRALPVVDADGRLRGLVTRAICLRAGENVMRAQDPFEIDYFTKRLKVKDVMVRNPATVNADDPMEHCLFRGQQDRMSQFPVLDKGRVVGILSASEVFRLAAKILGAWENWSGITLKVGAKEKGDLSRIAAIVDEAGAVLTSLYAVARGDAGARRIIVRFTGADAEGLAQVYRAAGYTVAEVSANVCEGRPKQVA